MERLGFTCRYRALLWLSRHSWVERHAAFLLLLVSGKRRHHTAGEGGFLNVEQILLVTTSSTDVSCGCHVDRPTLTAVERPSPHMSGSVTVDPLTSGHRTPRLSTPHSDIFIVPPPPLLSVVVFRNSAICRPSSFCWRWCRPLQPPYTCISNNDNDFWYDTVWHLRSKTDRKH